MGYLGNQITTVFPTSISVDSATIKGDATIGDASATDKKILFDGNAQDFHIGLDDSADSLTIGLGSALGTTSHMVIDANGHITKPNQPKFLVVKNADQSNVALNTVHDVSFETEKYDVGSNFASNVFTAPVTGYYLLTCSLRVDNLDVSEDYYSLRINYSNGEFRNLLDPDVFAVDATYFPQLVTGIANMDAGDTAKVQFSVSNGGSAQADIKNDEYRTYFSGHLLS